MNKEFITRLLDDASRPFLASGRFAYHFARGKLSSDCIFSELLRRGVFPARGRFLDLGCGQAVLASWLLAARSRFQEGDWPQEWPHPPQVIELHGYELMPKDVQRGATALAAYKPQVLIEQGDICQVEFGQADVVTILDVLHYIDYAAQENVLRRVYAALGENGLLVTRVGDADGRFFAVHFCNWLDRLVVFLRSNSLPKLYCRRLADWIALLQKIGFQVTSEPMSMGKPFVNVMLIARVANG